MGTPNGKVKPSPLDEKRGKMERELVKRVGQRKESQRLLFLTARCDFMYIEISLLPLPLGIGEIEIVATPFQKQL
jgi:hypothetical protein